MSTSESRLSRQKIAAVAFAIADKEGLEAVSMRRLARELEVGTMSLYYYVKTKDDLIAAMDDALMGEIVLPSLSGDWRRAMMEIAERTRSIYLRHPWALVSLRSAPHGPNAMRHMEQCLEALAETSMSDERKVALLLTIDDFVFGHTLRAAAADPAIDVDFAAAQLATGAFPRLAEVFARGPVAPGHDRFEEGVRALLDAAARWTE